MVHDENVATQRSSAPSLAPPEPVMLLDWRAIWIGPEWTENGWTGFGLIGNQLLELQWPNLISPELSLIEWS
jgi:hypothetical protein